MDDQEFTRLIERTSEGSMRLVSNHADARLLLHRWLALELPANVLDKCVPYELVQQTRELLGKPPHDAPVSAVNLKGFTVSGRTFSGH